MKPTFYLDLDRTLFRTDQAAEVFAMIEQLYPANYHARNGYARRAEHYVYPRQALGDRVTYYHDVAQWLRDVGIDEQEAFARLSRSTLADGRFEYSGVAQLVSELRAHGDVKLLTYGEDRYQRFKASLCPSLKGLEIITTLEPKSDYLNEFGRKGDWVIDDKRIEGLKPGITAIRVVHNSDEPDICHSLDEVRAIVEARVV